MQAELRPQLFEALRTGVCFHWTAAWAIVTGLVVTSLVQACVSKERTAAALGDGDVAGLTNDAVRCWHRRARPPLSDR